MKFVIDTDKLAELNITPDVAFYIASLYFSSPITRDTFNTVCSKGFIEYKEFSRGFPVEGKLTQEGIDTVESLFLNSEIVEIVNDNGESKDRFIVLADKLRELFPKGRKPGTNLQWRDSTAIISKRLKAIIKKYEISFTDEEAIEATRRYIASFNGNYQYMQVLRYFLWKEDRINGESSQFLSYIQNEDSDIDDNWTSILR